MDPILLTLVGALLVAAIVVLVLVVIRTVRRKRAGAPEPKLGGFVDLAPGVPLYIETDATTPEPTKTGEP